MTKPKPKLVYLSPPQRTVLDEMCSDGASIADIAGRLDLSEHTVAAQMRCIRSAFGSSSAAQVIAYALNGRVKLVDSRGKADGKVGVSTERRAAPRTVHMAPEPGAVLLATACCHRLTGELAGRDELTRTKSRVTCGGPKWALESGAA